MISVVIPAYNEEKMIAQCLDSFVAQKTSKKFEVIVVDNNSADKTREIVEKYKEKLNLKIVFEKRKGRGTARAAGFKKAKGEIIFSTDADTIVPKNWLEEMACQLEDENYVAVTGSCFIKDCSLTANTLFNFFHPIVMILYKLFVGHFWLSGFNFAIKKKAYLKSGGFNPQINVQEDVDLSFKVDKIGKIKFVRQPRVIFSGRRFKTGLTAGTLSYVKSYLEYFLFRKKEVYLSDIR